MSISLARRIISMIVFSMALAVWSLVDPTPLAAVEVGQAAPEFTLPSTTGPDISLAEFKGKKWIFLEFYGSDYAPT
jgi:hypothetical protein